MRAVPISLLNVAEGSTPLESYVISTLDSQQDNNNNKMFQHFENLTASNIGSHYHSIHTSWKATNMSGVSLLSYDDIAS